MYLNTKVCYNEKEPIANQDYVTPITNQKGERYYMVTFHFYKKMEKSFINKNKLSLNVDFVPKYLATIPSSHL